MSVKLNSYTRASSFRAFVGRYLETLDTGARHRVRRFRNRQVRTAARRQTLAIVSGKRSAGSGVFLPQAPSASASHIQFRRDIKLQFFAWG